MRLRHFEELRGLSPQDFHFFFQALVRHGPVLSAVALVPQVHNSHIGWSESGSRKRPAPTRIRHSQPKKRKPAILRQPLPTPHVTTPEGGKTRQLSHYAR